MNKKLKKIKEDYRETICIAKCFVMSILFFVLATYCFATNISILSGVFGLILGIIILGGSIKNVKSLETKYCLQRLSKSVGPRLTTEDLKRIDSMTDEEIHQKAVELCEKRNKAKS